MNRQVFENGVLVEEWDDDTRTYTAWNTQGVQTSTRPYTTVEQEQADAAAAAEAEQVEKTVRREAREALLDATLEASEKQARRDAA